MAEDVTETDEPLNHCCVKWKEKYSKLKERCSKLEEGRNALRKGLSILEPQYSKMQAENVLLKKALEDERSRGNLEKEERAKESEIRAALENEISALKCEMLSLQQNGGVAAQRVDQEILVLRSHISEGEVEINRLKELLEKERKRADVEKRKAEAERKKADEAAKKVKVENSRANEEKKLADVERRKTKEFSLQLEAFKCDVNETKSKLALVTAKFEEMKDKLNAESLKTTMEMKRADAEMAKVEKQRKAAEANWKKLMDEKRCSDNLSHQLEKTSKRVEELEKEMHERVSKKKLVELPFDQTVRHPSTGSAELARVICSEVMKRESNAEDTSKRLEKVKKKMIKEKQRAKSEKKKAEEQRQFAEAYKKVAMEEKHHSDQLSHELGCCKLRLKEAQEEIQSLISSKKMLESSTPTSGVLGAETAEMKLLRKQLKFEKMRVKHTKQVAKMERGHNQILGKEVIQLKQDLLQLLQRLDAVGNYVLQRHERINELGELGSPILGQEYINAEACQRKLSYGNLTTKPSWPCMATGGFDPLEQNRDCTASLPPISREIYTRSKAGIGSKLEPLKRGPNSNMLQTCVIDTSSTSFSDRPSLVSHDRGAFSVNNSPELTDEIQNRELIPSRFSSDTKKSYNEKHAEGAENSVGSPIKRSVAVRTGNLRKRNRILDAVVPVEHHMHSTCQTLHQQVLEKLHFPHRVLNSQTDNSMQENRLLTSNLHGSMCKEFKSHKKRKSSARPAVAAEDMYDEIELMTSPGTSGVETLNICNKIPTKTGNQTATAHVGMDGKDGPSKSKEDLPRNFFEILDSDPMKLFDFDDDLDEERYQNAIERPISPISPLIDKFQNNEAPEICQNIPSSICTSFGGLSYPKNTLPSCDFDVISLEIDSNKQTIDTLGSSKLLTLQENRYSDSTHESLKVNEKGNSNITCDWKISGPGRNLDMGCNLSIDQDSLIPAGSNRVSSSTGFPRFYIVSSNDNDSSSILRIFQACNCLSQFFEVSSLDIFLQNILLALQKADDLSAKEIVCSFVSSLLCYTCKITEQSFEEIFNDLDSVLFVNSFAQQMHAVLFDVEDIRRMFMEFLDMHELLYLMEDFLLNRRVLVYDKMTVESNVGCGSGFKIVSDGDCLFLPIQVVPMKFLVAGGVLFASVCVETDQIGFICELSYNMIRMQKSNCWLILRFLHLFAHVCGSKYFNLEGYDLQMSVLKSLVFFLEKLNSSIDGSPCFAPALDAASTNSFCCKCPFSDNVASSDVIVTVLLEKLQEHTLECSLLYPKEAYDQSNPGVLSKGEGTEEVSGHSEAENLFRCIDMLSLLELVAGVMNWEWTFGKIISPLLKMMELCIPEDISTAIITLFGQLGRDGIDAKGYQDPGVKSLRDWLSTFVCQSTSRKFGLPIQFSSVIALLGLINRSFQDVMETNVEIPIDVSQSDVLTCIRSWFSSLDTEQQSSFWLLNSSTKDNLQKC